MPRSRRSYPTDERRRRLCISLALIPFAGAFIALVVFIVDLPKSSPDGGGDATGLEASVPSAPATAAPIGAPSASTPAPSASDAASETEPPAFSSLPVTINGPSPPPSAMGPNTPALVKATASPSAAASEEIEINSTSSNDVASPSSDPPTSANAPNSSFDGASPLSVSPSAAPTGAKSSKSASPTQKGADDPTGLFATRPPTASRTTRPSGRPSTAPTTRAPSEEPTALPTSRPTAPPSEDPTRRPTESPTRRPSNDPTRRPTNDPTRRPSDRPTGRPSDRPTRRPSTGPTDPPTWYRGEFPYPLPSFRYREWSTLDEAMQRIAADKLGYTPVSWNVIGGGFAPVENKGWTELTFDERRGAIQLGYTKDTWDCFVDHYKSWTWDALRTDAPDAHRSALVLGWRRSLWDGDGRPESDTRWWGDLSDDERTAANDLCYFEDNWNEVDLNPNPGYFPHPLPEFRYVPWDALSTWERLTAREGLGYVRATWDLPDTNPLEASGTYWDLTPEQRDAARVLGFYPHTWDCHVNHYNAFFWRGFYGDTKLAVETLGWTVESWDGNAPGPDTEDEDWDDLSPEERAAATLLCYFKELWDDVPITEWYDYQSGANTAVSLDGPMPDDIDMSVFRGGDVI